MEEGWIEWRGGECPVADPYHTEVEVRLRDGGRNSYCAFAYDWEHQCADGTGSRDIVAYRILPTPTPGAPDEQ